MSDHGKETNMNNSAWHWKMFKPMEKKKSAWHYVPKIALNDADDSSHEESYRITMTKVVQVEATDNLTDG